MQKQIGDDKHENTARWIISEGIKRFPKSSSLYITSASMELSMHSVEAARRILRQSIQCSVSVSCIGHLAILEFFGGNIDTEDVFCTHNLMKRMERVASYSTNSLRYLYHCCVFLERTKDAERYHRQLVQRPDYNNYKSSDTIEKFIQLCQEAFI